jgi:hypothetical protein
VNSFHTPSIFAFNIMGNGTVTRVGKAAVSLVNGWADFGSFTPRCEDGPNCFGQLRAFYMVLNDFPLDGHEVKGLTVSILDPIDTDKIIPVGFGGTFLFPIPKSSLFHARAEVDGANQSLDLMSSEELAGSFNVDKGTFTLQLALSGNVFNHPVELTAMITSSKAINRPPRVGPLAAADTVASGGSCSAPVSLSVQTSDPDGDSVAVAWSDEGATLGAGANLVASLPVGKHTIGIEATDGKGSVGYGGGPLAVVDGNPPRFSPVSSAIALTGCSVGPSSVHVSVPTASNICGESSPVEVTGTLVDWNGSALSNAVSPSGDVTIPGPGSGHIRWVAQGVGGVSVFVQSLSFEPEATFDGQESVQIGSGFSGAEVVVRSESGVTLGTNSHVGEIRAGGQIVLATGATAAVVEHQPGPSSVAEPSAAFTGGPDVNVVPGQSKTISPGDYGVVNVNPHGTLELLAGTYRFESFTLGTTGKLLLIQAPSTTTVFVHSSAAWRGECVGPDGSIASLQLVYVGTNSIELECAFSGTVAAPNSELELDSSSQPFVGAFRALRISVDSQAQVTSRPPRCP